jgi:hypothetical protein
MIAVILKVKRAGNGNLSSYQTWPMSAGFAHGFIPAILRSRNIRSSASLSRQVCFVRSKRRAEAKGIGTPSKLKISMSGSASE